MSDLIYKASEFQRHLWKDHKMVDKAACAAERSAEERYQAFPTFAGEMFHFFHADEPDALDEPASGSDVFQKLDRAMREVPEVGDLRAQTIGNDRWSGVATSSMIDTLLQKVPAPESQIEDVRSDEEAAAYLERLMKEAEESGDAEQASAVKEALEDIAEGIEAKKEASLAAAEEMDPTDVREAIRGAVKTAAQNIQKAQSLFDAYGVGSDPHSGRRAQMAMGAKLSKIVGSNDRLLRIAELAGRLRRVAEEEQRKKLRFGCGERVGRKPDNDLARLCYRELVYGADEIRHVFASKYAERSLACIEKADKKKRQKGPIVMALDSSGSMSSGDADVWAAAVCLAYMDVARKQGRDFAIVHFGSSVLRVDKFVGSDAMTPEAVTEAVNFFAADGGTNFQDSLNEAVKIIEETGAFTEADIVMVTDGCAHITEDWLRDWDAKREELDFNCYSIMVGSHCRGDVNKRFSDEVEHLAEAIRDEAQMHHLFGKV